MNCEAYSSFEWVSSDHRIISANIHLSQCRTKTWTDKASWYDWSSIAKSNKYNQYMVTVRNKFDTLQEIFERHISNDQYENSVTAHVEAAVECILIKSRANVKFSESH